MTVDKRLKKDIRARMAETGETYTEARSQILRGRPHEPLPPPHVKGPVKVVLYQEIPPQDESPTLPRGLYEVRDLQWISGAVWDREHEEEIHGGTATFVVVSGEFAGSKRRIGVVVEEEYEAERLVIMAGWGIEEFESAARGATAGGLDKAKKLFAEILSRNANDSRSKWGITFIDKLLAAKGVE